MGSVFSQTVDVSDLIFPHIAPTYDASHPLLVHIPTDGDEEVPALLIAPPLEGSVEQLGALVTSCVIYFHPNAVDIGGCVEDLLVIRDGAYDGDAVILAPEYPGYGLLFEYEASTVGIDRAAAAAWRYCTKQLGFSCEQVVLWGRSIGTGPAACLALSVAKQRSTESGQLPVGGLVLIAPFTSLRSIILHHTGSSFIASLVAPLWEVLSTVKDPNMKDVALCVVHPQEDEVVPGAEGLAVFRGATSKRKFGVWLPNATHNFAMQDEHLPKVRSFMDVVIQNRLTTMSSSNPTATERDHTDRSQCSPRKWENEELAQRLLHWSEAFDTELYTHLPKTVEAAAEDPQREESVVNA